MSTRRAGLAMLGAALLVSGPNSALRVFRTSPNETTTPSSPITVTFDRPVAGSLDYSVDPHSVLRLSPAAPGTVQWRDPVTIVFTPTQPLRSGTTYTVTVSSEFHAMDGATLEKPYSFSFRVRGPTILAGDPVSNSRSSYYLRPTSVFRVVYSAPVVLSRLTTKAYVQFDPVCGSRVIRLRATGQRPIAKDDIGTLAEAGSWQRNRAEDSLRRVVTLVPTEPMPPDCGAQLVAPLEADSANLRDEKWAFRTHGAFTLDSIACSERPYCPTGAAMAFFHTPVRGGEVLHHLRLVPETKFTVRDTNEQSAVWPLDARLLPHTAYAAVADSGIHDIFAQRLTGNPAAALRTTGYEPTVEYMHGKIVAERNGRRTLSIQHVNVDTLVALVAPVPDSLEARFLSGQEWSWKELWSAVKPNADVRRIAVHAREDHGAITSLPLPVMDARVRGAPTLFAVKVVSARTTEEVMGGAPVALVQLTNLGIHARVGLEEAAVWVTGIDDGLPRAGVAVSVYDSDGRVLGTARTGPSGLAYLTGFKRLEPKSPRRPVSDDEEDDGSAASGATVAGYVSAVLGEDRGVVSVSESDPDLSPWRFGVSGAWGEQREAIAGAVFTERGIYRPGELVYAKAIVRTGKLGALRTPSSGDSLRWELHDLEGASVHETTTSLSEFGTATLTLPIAGGTAIGRYDLLVRRKIGKAWREVARTSYRVAEYRPPEFLVEMGVGADSVRYPGDTLHANIQARYLFGAPMGRAAVTWRAEARPMYGASIPKLEDWYVGETGAWWEDNEYGESSANVVSSGTDTLDAAGHLRLRVPVSADAKGRPMSVTVTASVNDVNRQAVASSTSAIVHSSSFYLAAKSLGDGYFWTVGKPAKIAVLAVRPDGRRLPGIAVTGTIVRREWHQVRRERDGTTELVGEWVSDTVARCRLTTAAEAATCNVTPAAGGAYIVTFAAKDERGRKASTSFYRWSVGTEWVPWNDESEFKMDVIADRTRYSVGDTATILFASPFTGAEAWVTIEREGVLEQRRLQIESGTTTLKLPIGEAYAPNVFVSILVARGRSAAPSTLDDAGRPTIRVGYAELRVTPEVKRLTVDVKPLAVEYRPGDSARVQLAVRDRSGAGQRAEVALWAVDEGVLALTAYTTPDPLDLLYQERGLGMRLASNMVAVVPQLPEGEKGRRSAGGGGGAEGADILRSQFRSTAFFLGSVVTDPAGHATVAAKLPDNLTTFRVMAVAVTANDRYGSGQASILVTRPLVARPAMPRFTRPGDRFLAGAVINQRAGGTPQVTVHASVKGASLGGATEQRTTLEAGRGREVRFDFRTTAEAGDSAAFRFAVSGAGDADAVEKRLPVMATSHPRAHTIVGTVRDTASAELPIPFGTDLAKSRLTLSFGTSPMVVLRGLYQSIRVYEYDCTEQVTSEAVPLIAMARVGGGLASRQIPSFTRGDIERAVAIIKRRQRSDGGIGYWGPEDWSTPWLSAYAGNMLLDARSLGVPVDSGLLARVGDYLQRSLKADSVARAPVMGWYDQRKLFLGNQVAAVDFLSRVGRPELGAENELMRVAGLLWWEDRVHLANVLARRPSTRAVARQLLTGIWTGVKVIGRRAIVPDSVSTPFYFPSRVRAPALLLASTIAVDSVNPLIGPLVETVLGSLRARAGWWNTQDIGMASIALAAFDQRQRAAVSHGIRVRSGGRLLLQTGGELRDTSIALTGLVSEKADSSDAPLRLSLEGAGSDLAYYSLTFAETPRAAPVRPDEQGIAVERWYEQFETGKPAMQVTEGELVRVRLRITVPVERRFVVVDDALPAGLEAVDLSLRTASPLAGPGAGIRAVPDEGEDSIGESDLGEGGSTWGYGMWDAGWWSPFDHREIRDDRVVYFATLLWKGTYTASYIARATTAGTFIRPPAIAEEMYNPAVQGRSDGGVFTVSPRPK